jgi:hypothetical protein
MADLDRISELPKDLKETILVCLPIKEAVKTSCLSSKWRYAWTCILDLVFHKDAVKQLSDESARVSKLIKLVDIILLLHRGPIHKFELEYWYTDFNVAIHRWMVILSRNGIRNLNITVHDCNWKLHSSFFTASNLTDVRLEGCIIKLPQSFNDFEHLKSLKLLSCEISDKDLDNLLSNCPLLENLHMAFMNNSFVRIKAPKLRHVYLSMDGLKHFHLIAPILVHAILHLVFNFVQDSCENILEDVFGSLFNIEMLNIGYPFMEVIFFHPLLVAFVRSVYDVLHYKLLLFAIC